MTLRNWDDYNIATPRSQPVPNQPVSNQPVSALPLDISHELRTPLTAIQAALELLNSGKLGLLNGQGQRMLTIAQSNVDRLMRLTAALEHNRVAPSSLISAEELAILRLETDLHHAVPRQELCLHYQPLVSLVTGKITGFEALVRWQHPSQGMVAPDRFIPLAEANGLIIELGAWVLQEACRQFRQWQLHFAEQVEGLSVSVNLSSRQLAAPTLVSQIDTVLQTTKLPAKNLKLEITESAIMENAEAAELVLGEIRALGVQLYIDDFGTGYSSLSRLLELPLDVLKIDRSFVKQLCSERGEFLVRAIANLAQNLGADVIAEGVETQEQVEKLQALGCQRGQGYFFAKPLPAKEVEVLFQTC
ncbi:EAL domain-containing protein [Phormidium tenue FACHB-886]|nr:EAL domain-containing protein [Phormidium tenue FACHB-886]